MYVIGFVAYYGASNIAMYEILNAERVKMSNLITSVDDIRKDKASLTVYPNPTAQKTNVSFDLSESKSVSVEVFDLTGKLMFTENKGTMVAGKHNVELDLSAYSEGFYFMNVRLNEEVITRKISVVR